MNARSPKVRWLGRQSYEPVCQSMRRFTMTRQPQQADEFWLLEHEPVYSLGQAGKKEHVLRTDTGIPLVQSDRGGQVTYHGPGQLVLYTLVDLKAAGLGVRDYVTLLENAVVAFLQRRDIDAHARRDAPGVYIGEAKIAALGLRVKRGCCYHGLSFNIDMDLTPFAAINPCGFEGLAVTQLADWSTAPGIRETGEELAQWLCQALHPDRQTVIRETREIPE